MIKRVQGDSIEESHLYEHRMSNDANRHVIGRHGNVTKSGNIYGIVQVQIQFHMASIGLPSNPHTNNQSGPERSCDAQCSFCF